MNDSYDDIIHLSPPSTGKHPKMSRLDRAAQFSPFAALTGFDGEIRETARLTGTRIEPDEQERVLLDERMRILRDHLEERPWVRITYFVADKAKAGGAYVTSEGRIQKLHSFEGYVLLDTHERIPLADIIRLESPIFP